jgi:hypothetical protein
MDNYHVLTSREGMLRVSLVILFMKLFWILTAVPFRTIPKDCVELDIRVDQLEEARSHFGLIYHDRYWAVRIHNTTVGLHAIFWTWIHCCYLRVGV